MSDILDAAWSALEEGQPEEALELLERADDVPQRWAAATLAYLGLEDFERAESALNRANATPAGRDDADVLIASGELHLARWRTDEAHAAFDKLCEREPSVEGLERLSLCCDLRGDVEGADRALQQAHELDPESRPLPPRLSPEEFENVTAAAVEELPEAFREALNRVAIVIDPVPGAGAVVGDGRETPPDLLGLFVGPSLLETSVEASAELPPTVYLFQRNLERISADRDVLLQEIQVTLYHELGHALGFDEEGVDEMGLG
ncbi:MAG: metallopeptidase family protein [Planctomycetota bacterium]